MAASGPTAACAIDSTNRTATGCAWPEPEPEPKPEPEPEPEPDPEPEPEPEPNWSQDTPNVWRSTADLRPSRAADCVPVLHLGLLIAVLHQLSASRVILAGISEILTFPKSILIRTDNLVRTQVNLAGISERLTFPKSMLIRTDNLVRTQVNLAGISEGLTWKQRLEVLTCQSLEKLSPSSSFSQASFSSTPRVLSSLKVPLSRSQQRSNGSNWPRPQ